MNLTMVHVYPYTVLHKLLSIHVIGYYSSETVLKVHTTARASVSSLLNDIIQLIWSVKNIPYQRALK